MSENSGYGSFKKQLPQELSVNNWLKTALPKVSLRERLFRNLAPQ